MLLEKFLSERVYKNDYLYVKKTKSTLCIFLLK
jgi:hypothetical protein